MTDKWGITSNKVVAFITENGGNIVKAITNVYVAFKQFIFDFVKIRDIARITTYLKTNQDISSNKLKDIPTESTECEVFLGGEESSIETLRSLLRKPVLMQMNTTEYEVNLVYDSEEVHFNEDIVMLNSSNNIEYHDLELLTSDVENVLEDNMVHEGVKSAEENIREQTIPSENDEKIELSNNDVETDHSEIDEQAQLLQKERKTVLRCRTKTK
ncbi:hypothetical protein HHI36_003760 [Cryptolaemus montrouzieri]|uniref:Uncharacterized protein n=2 Tax=Cryptolaemus montrouzieri TaxID=559131 RepID=A0ABD2PF54_9CUCU